MKKIFPFIFVLLICTLSFCTSDNIGNKMMDRADALIDEYPDSAKAVLDSIGESYRFSSEGEARLSLLNTFASLKSRGVKNVSNSEIDSMFLPAYKYYRDKSNTSRETMLFHFVNALIQDSVEVSIKEFDRTIDLASGIEDWDYKALAWLNKAALYYGACSSEDEIACIDTVFTFFDKVKRQDIRMFALESAGQAYMGIEDDEKAQKYFLDYLALVQESGDSTAIYKAKLNLASTYSLQGRHEEAVKIFDEIMNSDLFCPEFRSGDLYYFAVSLIERNRLDEASTLIKLLKEGESPSEKLSYYLASTRLFAAKGYYREAYSFNDSVTKCSNALISERMQYNLPRKEKDMEKRFAELSKANYENIITIHRLFAVIILLFLLSGAIIMAFFIQRKRLLINKLEKDMLEKEKYDKTLEEKIEIIKSQKEHAEKMLYDHTVMMNEELKEAREEVKKSIDKYEEKISQLQKEKSENMLFYVKSEAKLCNKNIRSNDKEKRNLGKAIIEKYRKKDFQEKLIKVINDNSNNILDYISNDVNSEEGILIVVFDICKFSYVSIAEIFNITTTNASARKTRVKQKLTAILDNHNRKWLTGYIPMLKE